MSLVQDTKKELEEENNKLITELAEEVRVKSNNRKFKNNSKRTSIINGKFKLLELLARAKIKK